MLDLVIEPVEREWSTKQTQSLNVDQLSMFDLIDSSSGGNDSQGIAEYKKLGLEKIPFKFSYHFICNDNRCKGHTLQILDWEISQAFRKWPYHEKEKLNKIEEKFLTEFTTKKDLYLYLGTLKDLHRFDTFSIIGVFYPPKT